MAKEERKLNYDKSLFEQIQQFNPKEYKEEILESTKNRKIFTVKKNYFFRPNSFIEKFTRWSWWILYLFWFPITIHSFIVDPFILILKCIFMTFGLFVAWPLLEYTLHRFILHHIPKSKIAILLNFTFHGIHHLTPTDTDRITFPFFASIPIHFILYFFLKSFFGFIPYQAFYSGLALGYMWYELIHYHIHTKSDQGFQFIRKMSLFYYIQSQHLDHHSTHTINFGVTHNYFDVLFETYRSRERLVIF